MNKNLDSIRMFFKVFLPLGRKGCDMVYLEYLMMIVIFK